MATHAEELAAIERLHQRDMTASRAGDYAALRTLMTDDAVILPPGGHAIRGKAEREASMVATEQAMQTIEILEYVLDFEEVQIMGGYAFEWGAIRGAMRAKGADAIEHSSYKVMRILQKQADGEWKVHRTIWNENPKP